MKLQAALQLSLILSLALGTTCGANPVVGDEKLGVTAAAASTNPDLQSADERVTGAEAQLNLARKQLAAARSILKAAEADLRAARTEREALSLRTQAEGLAEEAGMRPDNNKSMAAVQTGVPRAIAQKQAQVTTTTEAPVAGAPVSTAPTASTPVVRTQQVEIRDTVDAELPEVGDSLKLR